MNDNYCKYIKTPRVTIAKPKLKEKFNSFLLENKYVYKKIVLSEDVAEAVGSGEITYRVYYFPGSLIDSNYSEFTPAEFEKHFELLRKDYRVQVTFDIEIYLSAESEDDAESQANLICDRISFDSTEEHEAIECDGYDIKGVYLH